MGTIKGEDEMSGGYLGDTYYEWTEFYDRILEAYEQFALDDLTDKELAERISEELECDIKDVYDVLSDKLVGEYDD